MTLHAEQTQAAPVPAGAWARAQDGSGLQNISNREQLLSLGIGGILAAVGLRRGRLTGAVAVLAGGGLLYRGLTGHCHVYQALGIDTASHPQATAVPAQAGVHVEESLAINVPASEVFRFWQNPESLQQAFSHVCEVVLTDEGRMRWTAKNAFGQRMVWETEVFNKRENELLAWQSIAEGDVETAGSVRLRSMDQEKGTLMTVSLKYNPPGGKAGELIASLWGQSLEQRLINDLRNVKRLLEAGEIPTTRGQPSGRRSASA